MRELALRGYVAALLRLCDLVHHPPLRHHLDNDRGLEELTDNHTVSHWSWSILRAVVEEGWFRDRLSSLMYAEIAGADAVISTNHMPILLGPLELLTSLNESHLHRGSPTLRREDLSMMTAACTILERLAARDGTNLALFTYQLPPSSAHLETPYDTPSLAARPSALRCLADFIEMASSPTAWDLPRIAMKSRCHTDGINAEPDDEEALSFEEVEKTIGAGKAPIIRAVVAVSSEMEATDSTMEWFWNRMRSWSTREQRDDLVSCALLTFGNAARQGEAAFAVTANGWRLLRDRSAVQWPLSPSHNDTLASTQNIDSRSACPAWITQELINTGGQQGCSRPSQSHPKADSYGSMGV